MLLQTGGQGLRLERLADGKVLLRHVETNELKEVTDRQLFDALQSGQVQLQNTKVVGASPEIDPNNLSRLNAAAIRQESAEAVTVMVSKRRWIEGLKHQGITRLVDEAWVRVAVRALATGELADVPRFKISTLRSAARKVQQANGDWTVLIPKHSMRGGRGSPRIDPRAEEILKEILTNKSKTPGVLVKQKISDQVREVIRSQNLALIGDEIDIPSPSTIARRVDSIFTKHEITRCPETSRSFLFWSASMTIRTVVSS
jgi:hypothetical protein